MGTKQILPTRFLHLPEVTSPRQNLQHISHCGKQTNHFPNFLPFYQLSTPGVPDSFRHSLTWFTDHIITLRPHWTSEHANFFFFFFFGSQPVLFAFQKKALSCSSGSCVKSMDSDIYMAHSGFRIRVSTVQEGKWGSSQASRDHNFFFFFYCTVRLLFLF